MSHIPTLEERIAYLEDLLDVEPSHEHEHEHECCGGACHAPSRSSRVSGVTVTAALESLQKKAAGTGPHAVPAAEAILRFAASE